MQMAKLALQVILTAISLNAFAVKEATLCRDCATLPEAKQFVLYLASVSSCGGSAGPSQPDCVLNNHQSTVLDIESGNAFSFDVQFNDIASGTATVNYRAISPRGIAGFRQLAEFVRAIESSIKKASTTLARVPATNQSTNVARSASTVLLPDNNCPSDTALAALLSPNRMEQIRTDAMVRLGAELSQRVNAKKLEGVIGTDEAAVTVNGERFVGSFGYTRPIGAYLVTFNDTERQSAVQDYLVYDVSIMGYGSDDKPAFNVALSGFSRAAGYSLAALKGESGPLLIDNYCIIKRFDNAVIEGVLRQEKSTLANNRGCAGESDNASAQIKLIKLALYGDGRLKYTYRTCL